MSSGFDFKVQCWEVATCIWDACQAHDVMIEPCRWMHLPGGVQVADMTLKIDVFADNQELQCSVLNY